MAITLIGREEEQNILSKFFTSAKAELLALYGRRRIGKTFLVTEYFSKQDCIFFYTTGIKNAPRKKQIRQFTKIIGDVFYAGAELRQKIDWLETFELLTTAFNHMPKNKKIVLFMDEFPWMATRSSGLLDALDYYWNRYWISDKRIKLIICGSSVSWIIDKQYAENLSNKIKVFKQQTRTTKDLFINMVTSNGIKPTLYSKKIVSGVVTLDDF